MKYIVWIREGGRWVENGDGPMTKRDAERVSREIGRYFQIATRFLPVGMEPLEKKGSK